MERTCEQCGASFIARESVIARGYGRLCSIACRAAASRRNRVQCVCKHCHQDFTITPSDIANGRGSYCSQVCYMQARWGSEAHQVTLNCEQCGKTFTILKSSFVQGRGRFCSMRCRRQSEDAITRICEVCNTPFTIPKCYLKSGARRFCSRICFGKWVGKSYQGPNSPTWRGGLSFQPYPPTFNKQFKKMIRERDGYKCGFCGILNSRDVHHINYVKNDTTPENCITLCKRCHLKTTVGDRVFWQALCSEIMILRAFASAER
jgi:hypothetical protein